MAHAAGPDRFRAPSLVGAGGAADLTGNHLNTTIARTAKNAAKITVHNKFSDRRVNRTRRLGNVPCAINMAAGQRTLDRADAGLRHARRSRSKYSSGLARDLLEACFGDRGVEQVQRVQLAENCGVPGSPFPLIWRRPDRAWLAALEAGEFLQSASDTPVPRRDKERTVSRCPSSFRPASLIRRDSQG